MSNNFETQNMNNMKCKNMFLNNNNNNVQQTSSAINIDSFLDKETKISNTEPWSKLNKTIKIAKINNYVDTLINENNLSAQEVKTLKQYMLNCLDRKKLQCVKDVIYDKTTGKIKSIPCLIFNQTTRKFTLKRSDKRVSTLKSLGPGKTRKKTGAKTVAKVVAKATAATKATKATSTKATSTKTATVAKTATGAKTVTGAKTAIKNNKLNKIDTSIKD